MQALGLIRVNRLVSSKGKAINSYSTSRHDYHGKTSNAFNLADKNPQPECVPTNGGRVHNTVDFLCYSGTASDVLAPLAGDSSVLYTMSRWATEKDGLVPQGLCAGTIPITL